MRPIADSLRPEVALAMNARSKHSTWEKALLNQADIVPVLKD
jgi:hypothetical protein